MTLLPPPQAAGKNVAAITSRESSHIRRSFRSNPVARTQPISPSDDHAPANIPACSTAAVSTAAFTVNVALLPGVIEFGEIPHVGIGAGPLTEQASAMLPENPLWAPIVSPSPRYPGRVTFVSENFGASKLAERFGVKGYPAVFVDGRSSGIRLFRRSRRVGPVCAMAQ